MSQGAKNSTPLRPVSRRALQLAGLLSLLLIAVVVNSLLNQGSDSPFNPNPVAAAAERTQEVPGMRMTMTMRISTESAPPVTVSGGGVYNGEENLGQFTYHLTNPQGAPQQFDAVMGEGAFYFRYPQLASKMPEGKEWLKVEGLPGQSDLSKPSESPQSSLQMLSAAGSVQRLGRAQVRGVPTTRYRVTMTQAGIVETLRSQGRDEIAEAVEANQMVGPVHAEVFIDGHKMTRRMILTSTVVADGKTVTTEMHSDLFDFGIHPHIQLPDESQVFDLSPEQLEGLGQSS